MQTATAMTLFVYLPVVAILLALAYWMLGQCPLPDRADKIIRIVLAIICVLIVIWLLLSLMGGGVPMVLFPR